MADDYSGNESEDDTEYGGISEHNLRLIGVNPEDHASTSAPTDQPRKVNDVIKMLMSNSGSKGSQSNEPDLGVDSDAEATGSSPSKGRKMRGFGKSRLPKELQGLMGEANLKQARGEYEEVMVMCQAIIRSVPTAPEPYITLSVLHQDMGDTDSAYQFGLVGAHLDPRNTDEWLRLADMSMEAGNTKDCAYCYMQVARYDRENTEIMLESVQLELKLGEHKKAATVLRWILNSDSSKSNATLYMSVARELAKLEHEQGKHERAVKVLEDAIDAHPEFLTSEEVNMLAEFYIHNASYTSVVELFTKHCGVICSPESDMIVVPQELPLDLRSKLVVSLAHQSKDKQIEEIMGAFSTENADAVGDLFLDMSEALQDNGYHKLAQPLLKLLVDSRNYSQAAVWLKYSECLSALGYTQEAADAFGKVVEMAPNHVGARVQLSLLQQQLGMDQEALHTLAEGGVAASSVRNDWTGLEGKEPRLLLHTCLLLHSQAKLDEFFKYVQYLLFGQLPPHVIVEHESALLTYRPYKGRISYLRRILPDYDDVYKTPPALVAGDEALTENECWDLFNKACDTANEHKKYDTLFILVKSAFCTHAFYTKKPWNDEIEFKCICCHILLRHGGSSFDLIRESIMKMIANPDGRLNQIANIFSMITSISPHDIRFSRFSERLLRKHPTSNVMNIAHGNASIIFSSYRAAINQFITAYKQMGDSPMLNLLIGICFLHIVCMKFTTQRATLAVQGVCFLDRYLKLRGPCQESYYNLGRAMQQISINSAAVYYYRKCLETTPCLPGENFDLTKEAAFNLSLIYKASGSNELAEHVIQTHCVV